MPVNQELLDILCCPETKVPVKMMTADQVTAVNKAIEGGLKYQDGKDVDKPLAEGLITEDGKTIYRVDDDIPVMLVEMGIAAEGIAGL